MTKTELGQLQRQAEQDGWLVLGANMEYHPARPQRPSYSLVLQDPMTGYQVRIYTPAGYQEWVGEHTAWVAYDAAMRDS